MTFEELKQVSGFTDRQMFRVSNWKETQTAHSRQLPGVYFIFCQSGLPDNSFGIDGSFAKFAQLAKVETLALGEPDFQITHHNLMSLLTARWVDKD